MEEPKDKDDRDQGASGDQEVSQADVDALLSASADEEPSEPQAPDNAAAQPAEDAPQDPRVDTMGRPVEEAAAAMQAAMDEEKEGKAAPARAEKPVPQPPPASSRPVDLPEFSAGVSEVDTRRLSMLHDVKLHVKIELGRTRMLVEEVLKLGEGSVVELNKPAGDPVEVYVNDRLVARGEVLVLNDNFCVRISEVMAADPHRVSA